MLTVLSILRAFKYIHTVQSYHRTPLKMFYLPNLKLCKPLNSSSSLSLPLSLAVQATCLHALKYLVPFVKGTTQCLPVESGLFTSDVFRAHLCCKHVSDFFPCKGGMKFHYTWIPPSVHPFTIDGCVSYFFVWLFSWQKVKRN